MHKIIFELKLHETCEGNGEYTGLLDITRKTKDGDKYFRFYIAKAEGFIDEIPALIEEVIYRKTDVFGIKKNLSP